MHSQAQEWAALIPTLSYIRLASVLVVLFDSCLTMIRSYFSQYQVDRLVDLNIKYRYEAV